MSAILARAIARLASALSLWQFRWPYRTPRSPLPHGGVVFGGLSYAPYVEGGLLFGNGLPTGWEANPGLSASSLHHPASLTASVPLTMSAAAWANPASQQILRVRPGSLTSNYAPMFLLLRGDSLVEVQECPSWATVAATRVGCLAVRRWSVRSVIADEVDDGRHDANQSVQPDLWLWE